ncbi:MAG: hypothetical protein IJU37_09735 [Desulfovibrio sp.]|nr:hypothetical protein [Desulfovibrio sp.]
MAYRRNDDLCAVALAEDENSRSLLWREWLDTFYLAERRLALLQREPPMTHTVWDALLAASVAWLARKSGLPTPLWARATRRRASQPWWGGCDPLSRYARIQQLLAPPEFLTRNLFVSASILYRARMPAQWRDPEPRWSRVLAAKLLRRIQNQASQGQ